MCITLLFAPQRISHSCLLYFVFHFPVFPLNSFFFVSFPSPLSSPSHFYLSGWTGEKVCLAGDSAGGNLCVTTSMRAAAFGVRMPDGIVAAYPAILLTAYASPSRLLTLMDPLLPLSVLSRCLSAYAGRSVCVLKKKESWLDFFDQVKLRIKFRSIFCLSSISECLCCLLLHIIPTPNIMVWIEVIGLLTVMMLRTTTNN